ncbi:unnamed protein product [Urochloa decumbens]|uniref:DUF4408 domain-containing protein n=1 Tax=Urochloa decumbens TaxID=240449 RepID=A0ABC9BTQ3_9POAL
MAMEYMPSWPLSSWISPGAALFLLCNALIGAIVVTSSRGEQRGRAAASTRRLCRSASSMVLDRLRSFSIFSGHSISSEDNYQLELEAEEEQQPRPAVAEPAISTVASEGADDQEVAEAGEDETVISEEAHKEPARQGHALQLPAVVAGAVETEATAAAELPATVVGTIVQRARACRRELVEEALEGKAALNARAEMFIREFREDLKLQRLNSIINYTRALRRGACGAPAAAEQ